MNTAPALNSPGFVPVLDDAVAMRLRLAFRLTDQEHKALTDEPLPRSVMAFRVLRLAMAIEARMPDKERGWVRGGRSWPLETQLDPVDFAEAYLEMVRRIQSGEITVEEIVGRSQPSAQDVSMMDAILETFAQLTVGRHPERDFKIIVMAAKGADDRAIAREMGLTLFVATDRKNLQCSVIAKRLGPWIDEWIAT